MGLEALSRGAAMATFIDKSKTSLELARANVLHCGATQSAHFLLSDATRLPPLPAGRPLAALVLFDAPYAAGILAASYASLRNGNWLAEGALVVAEQALGRDAVALEGAAILDTRRYGKTGITIYQATSA
jgi:16S rRNA (guanine966-N2)-methyltransferase